MTSNYSSHLSEEELADLDDEFEQSINDYPHLTADNYGRLSVDLDYFNIRKVIQTLQRFADDNGL